jgi:hypothetical protein
MTVRVETMLNLLVVLILAVDAFVGLQVFQQRAVVADPVIPPSLLIPSTTVAVDGVEPTDTVPDGTGPIATTTGVLARNEVQSAVLAAQLAFVADGVMPADSFAIHAKVPGPRFVDGATRAAVGIIGVERTDTTILFVTAEAEQSWICASVDGPAEVTQYGKASTRDAMDDFASCIGTQDTWR